MLWCNNCNIVVIEEVGIKKGEYSYCPFCYRREGRYYTLTEHDPQDKPSVEKVGLDWDIDSKRGKALEVMKNNNIALNSDEALFLLYLEKYENQLIIRKPTNDEISDFANNILKRIHSANVDVLGNRLLDFIGMLRVPHTDLTSFQTLRLARQELKREAKRKGQMGIFNLVVEAMREERAEKVKERYIEKEF